MNDIDMAEIDITFRGTDYSQLNSAEFTVSSAKPDIPWKDFLEKDNNSIKNGIKLLSSFLDKLSNINVISSDLAKENNRKLYDPYFNGGYFCGVVGVLKKKNFVINTKNIFDADTLDDMPEYVKCNVTLQIQSRMDVTKDKEISKPFFLSTLLLNNKIQFNSDMVPSNEEEIFDYLLLFWFKNRLQQAFLKGYYKTYRRFEGNDDRLKGSIDIARHIRLNMGQDNGRIAYSYRENTVNNYLNHMIVAAYDHLKRKYYQIVLDNFDNNIELKSIIDNLRTEIGGVQFSPNQLIAKNLRPISHPFYTEYEMLRQICIRILREEGISLFDGEMDETEGVLFYLPRLWEEYLQGQIEKKLDDSLELKSQNEIKAFGYYDNGEWKHKQETRPDFVFYNNDKKPFMILDAKFKPKWGQTVLEITNISDVLDDYDKAIRDMVSIKGCASGVIFPMPCNQALNKNYVMHSMSNHNIIERFYTIPIIVPFSENMDYISWKKNFDENLDDNINNLCGIVEKESNFFVKYSEMQEELRKLREQMDIEKAQN